MNGNNASLKIWGATNYNGQIENTSWTALTDEVIGNLAQADSHPQQYVNGKIDLINYANATAFTLAFQYESTVSSYSQDSRNGTVYIKSSFHAFESDSLNTEIPDKIAQVKLYPNPTNHKINLNGLGSYHYEIRIYNMLGKVVLKKQNESQINVGHLKEGIYMVEIVSELGEKKAIPFIKK